MMSDASDMLAAALEQMDGIIAGTNALIVTNTRFTRIQHYRDNVPLSSFNISFHSLPKCVLLALYMNILQGLDWTDIAMLST